MKKKFLAIVFAFVMCASVSSTALADGRGGGKDLPGGNPPPPPAYCPNGIHGPCYLP